LSVRDGLGLKLLLEAGVQVGVISGRTSDAVASRCADLGIRSELVVLGSEDKVADLERLQELVDVVDLEVAAMGDDLPDLPLLERAVFSACPADAAPEVMAVCDLVCGAPGGRGAVREFVELILKVQGKWLQVTGKWVGHGASDT
jgi:3-deoxy-D-manno-octulosonate 8-phosphate phosphatase (KDO 8-P phosphatase)